VWSVECSFRWLQPAPSHTDRNGGHAEAAPQMRGRRGVWARLLRVARGLVALPVEAARGLVGRRAEDVQADADGEVARTERHVLRDLADHVAAGLAFVLPLVGLLPAVLPLGWRRRRRGRAGVGRSAVGRIAGDAAAVRRAAAGGAAAGGAAVGGAAVGRDTVGGAAVGRDTGGSTSSDRSVVRRPSRRVCRRRQGRRTDRPGRPTNLNCRLLLTTVARTRNPSWSLRALPM
jgi:hypothetical protein